MTCHYCNHFEEDHQTKTDILPPYCWECGKEYPVKLIASHPFIDNLKFLEQKYEESLK